MRVAERLDITAVTVILLASALLMSCSERATFEASGLVPDSVLVVDTLEVAEARWATQDHATSGMWQSERSVTCNWHGYRSRSFIGFPRPDTSLELQSAALYLYATRIEGDVGASQFELYTLLDSLKAGDIYWDKMPAADELISRFSLPEPGAGDIAEDSVFVDITEAVEDWIGGQSLRHGLMIKYEAEGSALEAIAEFGTGQSRNRPVETAEGDTVLVDIRPSMRIAYMDTANDNDTTLWYLPANDTFADTLVTPFTGPLLLVGNGFPSRSFVKFDLSSIPDGSTLTRAVLELRVAADSSSFDQISVICHASLESEWSGVESVIGSEGAGTKTLLKENFEADGTVAMDITPLVQPQVAGLVSNRGYVIKSTNEAYDLDYVRFYPDARLRVYYVLPTGLSRGGN
jgi:hypothetical protein